MPLPPQDVHVDVYALASSPPFSLNWSNPSSLVDFIDSNAHANGWQERNSLFLMNYQFELKIFSRRGQEYSWRREGIFSDRGPKSLRIPTAMGRYGPGFGSRLSPAASRN